MERGHGLYEVTQADPARDRGARRRRGGRGRVTCGERAREAAPARKTYKAGLVSDVGRFNDRSFNRPHSKAEAGAVGARSADPSGRVASTSDYVPNLAALARQGYDVAISVGFLLADATNTVAKRFPNSKFAIVDYSVLALPFKPSKNVRGILFADHEDGYMVGCLAAPDGGPRRHRGVGAVGGVKLPPVDIFIAGYRAGARKAGRRQSADRLLARTSSHQAKCKDQRAATRSRTARVVFQVAGGCGLGALDAARERRASGASASTRDQAYLGRHILASAVSGWTSASS